MTLQKCPECNKINPYWYIYKAINFRGFNKGTKIKCSFCENDIEIDYDFKNKRRLYLVAMSWMALPILIIVLAFFGIISYLVALILVTIFHFAAMYYVIKKMKYLIKK